MAPPDRPLESTEPLGDAPREARRRLPLIDEFKLALLPSVTVLAVFAFVEAATRHRLLFASLASSAFLIYLDPAHRTNQVRTLVVAQIGAAALGWLATALLGSGYTAGGLAMIATIVLMILFDVVHPPAVATGLSFSLRDVDERNVALFGLAVAMTALLVGMQRVVTYQLLRWRR